MPSRRSLLGGEALEVGVETGPGFGPKHPLEVAAYLREGGAGGETPHEGQPPDGRLDQGIQVRAQSGEQGQREMDVRGLLERAHRF